MVRGALKTQGECYLKSNQNWIPSEFVSIYTVFHVLRFSCMQHLYQSKGKLFLGKKMYLN